MRVEIISEKFTSPSRPTPPHLARMKISAIDQLPAPVYPANIFYYQANETNQGADNAERVKQLEESLSEILTLFYPLAGRYIRDNLLVECSDQGVKYLEARVSAKLSQVLSGEINVEQLNHFVPTPVESNWSPMLAVQINVFQCGGLAIGIRISHRIADGFTMTSFMEGWATACRVGIDKVACPSFCLSSFFPAIDVPGMKEDSSIKKEARIVTKVFTFDRRAIFTMKTIVETGAGCSGSPNDQPSRLDVVTAFIWGALIKVAKCRHGYLRPSALSHAVNMRGKTILPIPENSCGNFIRQAIARFDPKENRRIDLPGLMDLVRQAIRNAIMDCRKAIKYHDLFWTLSNSVKELYDATCNSESDLYMFNSLCHMPIYEVDFGWGKPNWVSGVHKPVPVTNLMDTKDGGIEAWLSLEEKDMILFEQDSQIIEFAIPRHQEQNCASAS